MRRYAETFFRYWLIIILPVIVLPAATYAMVRHTPKTVVATANILVAQSLAGPSGDWSQYQTAAQNEAADLNQLLQSPSFDLAVARTSPIYAQALSSGRTSPDSVVTDLSTNVQIVPKGPSMLGVSYSSKYGDVAVQVVNSLLGTARDQAQTLSRLQIASAITYYGYQLQNARQQLSQSTQKLRAYMSVHGVTVDQLNPDMAADPTLATLYRQNQADQAAVADAQQKITTYRTQSTLPANLVAGSFTVVDQPRITVVSSKKTQIMQLAIALVVGLLLAGIFLVAKTALDRSLRYVDEVEELLGLPVLSVVPYSRTLAVQRIGSSQLTAKAARRGPLHGLLRTGS
jgi:hypothetical protein